VTGIFAAHINFQYITQFFGDSHDCSRRSPNEKNIATIKEKRKTGELSVEGY